MINRHWLAHGIYNYDDVKKSDCLYDEDNGYEISPAPINDMVLTEEEIEKQRLLGDNVDKFDNEFKSDDENDTAFYYDG